ncbi:hypothetical protein BH11MYX1_BH11MYX1_44150 [soil metagenome]
MKLVFAGLLAGCWTSTPPQVIEPAQPPPSVIAHRPMPRQSPCELTVEHLIDVLHDELANVPDFADKLDTIHDIAVASCDETKWSPEVMRCFSATQDNTALAQCQSLLTMDQTSDLARRMTEVMSGAVSPPPVTP